MSDFKLIQQLEARLWSAADNLRANRGLTAQEYSRPVLGLIFLRYAEYRFSEAKKRLEAKASTRRRRSGGDIRTSIQAEGAMLFLMRLCTPACLSCLKIVLWGWRLMRL